MYRNQYTTQYDHLTVEHAHEVDSGERLQFCCNWGKFLKSLNEERICRAEESLKQMLDVHSLRGKSFIDVGSGSRLISLAARRLGGCVHPFDYDPNRSVQLPNSDAAITLRMTSVKSSEVRYSTKNI